MKKNAAKKAVEFVKGKDIGLGTGSTVEYFIDFLSKKKLRVNCICSSERTFFYAKKKGLKIVDIDKVKKIDVLVDGVDEIDSEKRMIKGRGGALLREKFLAKIAEKYIIICDETKLVKKLGKGILPVEVVSYGISHTKKMLEKYFPKLRMKDKKPFITDNGNYILDLKVFKDVIMEEKKIRITGVLETGIFLGFNPKVIVGCSDGRVNIW